MAQAVCLPALWSWTVLPQRLRWKENGLSLPIHPWILSSYFPSFFSQVPIPVKDWLTTAFPTTANSCCAASGRNRAEPHPSQGLCSHSHFGESLCCSSPGIWNLQVPCFLISDYSSLGEERLVPGVAQVYVMGWKWGRAGSGILLCITGFVTHLVLPVTAQTKFRI